MKYNIDYFVHPETDARNCNYHSIKKDEQKDCLIFCKKQVSKPLKQQAVH